MQHGMTNDAVSREAQARLLGAIYRMAKAVQAVGCSCHRELPRGAMMRNRKGASKLPQVRVFVSTF
jgi:hypothetical protein